MKISYKGFFDYLYQHHISQAQVAKRTGVSRNTLHKMTFNEPVNLKILMNICDAYELHLNDVLTEVEE